MKILSLILLAALAAGCSPKQDPQLDQMQRKTADLEQRVAEVEKIRADLNYQLEKLRSLSEEAESLLTNVVIRNEQVLRDMILTSNNDHREQAELRTSFSNLAWTVSTRQSAMNRATLPRPDK
jgi:septal ring factor EnvC (AmiA/AmiB activator)